MDETHLKTVQTRKKGEYNKVYKVDVSQLNMQKAVDISQIY